MNRTEFIQNLQNGTQLSRDTQSSKNTLVQNENNKIGLGIFGEEILS